MKYFLRRVVGETQFGRVQILGPQTVQTFQQGDQIDTKFTTHTRGTIVFGRLCRRRGDAIIRKQMTRHIYRCLNLFGRATDMKGHIGRTAIDRHRLQRRRR